jgi:hypothetical protein
MKNILIALTLVLFTACNSDKNEDYKAENEQEIDKICAELNNEPPEKTANVYKYISDNNFYHDFMLEHYKKMIER